MRHDHLARRGLRRRCCWQRNFAQAAGLAFLFAATLFGQSESGVIYGRVTDSRGQPQSLMVHLLADGDIPAGDQYTDGQGQFAFQAVPSGEYWVVVEADGFQTVHQHVRLDATINPRVQVNPVLEAMVATGTKPSPVISGSALSHTLDAKKPVPDFNPKALREFDKGNRSRQKGDLQSAIAHYEKAVEIEPRLYPALNNLGAIYEIEKDHKRAEEALRKALEIDPGDGEGYFNLGHVFYEEGRYAEALAQLQEGLKRSPNSAMGHFFLGSTYFKLGKLGQAESSLKRAASLDPQGMPKAHLQLANVYLQGRNLVAASQELETYLRANPSDPQAPAIHKLLASIRTQNN
jgi:Tfp pilus assembly protein PilF